MALCATHRCNIINGLCSECFLEKEQQEQAYLFNIFQKLKNFYAQPLDGYWPLRPKWVPDITKQHKYKTPYSNMPACIVSFRRFTFEEFCKIFKLRIWNDIKE